MRTVVVTNHEPNATLHRAGDAQQWWTSYPDDDELKRRTFQRSDSRLALAPFIAYKYLKDRSMSFKWLYVSPGNSMFFVGGAQKAAENLDANMPYFLSGEDMLN